MDFTRRDFLYLSSLTAASLAFIERGGLVSAASAEERFTVAMDGGSWGEGIVASFIDATDFRNLHGADPAIVFGTAAVNQTKAIAECGNPSTSVVGLPDIEAVRVAEGGCLEDYDLSIVTNYPDVIEPAKLPPVGALKNWHAGIVSTVFALTWNTEEATQPQSYNDLMNPEYKGRVGIPIFTENGEPWMHGLNVALGGTADDLSPAIEWCAELARTQDPVFIENTDHCLQLFTRREIVMAPFWNGRTFQLQDAGVPVEVSYVPGTFQYAWGLHVSKGTAHRELANELVNLSLDPVYQLEMLKRTGYPPTNSKAKLPPEMANRAIPADAIPNFVSLEFGKIIASSAQNLERWNKEVIGQG